MVATAAAKEIKWGHDFTKASKEAGKAGKPIMVDFYTDWCGWCKRLDRDTYSDSRVVDESAKFVCVKVNGDKYRNIVRKYRIDGYPTIIFFDKKTKELGRIVGYRNADDFLAAMKIASKKR